MTQQQAFTSAKNSWNAHSWTPDETERWFLYCKRTPIRNKEGQQCFMFPYIAFLHINISRLLIGLSVLYEPPLL